MKQKTFMQIYREWSKSGTSIRATLDKDLARRIGFRTCIAIDKYDALVSRIQKLDIHRRINWRAHLVHDPDWPKERTQLLKQWRSIAR